MADINTGRKRKNSESEAGPEAFPDAPINDKNDQEQVDTGSAEPALKCPRKSDVLEPNLQDKEQVQDVSENVAVAEKSEDCSEETNDLCDDVVAGCESKVQDNEDVVVVESDRSLGVLIIEEERKLIEDVNVADECNEIKQADVVDEKVTVVEKSVIEEGEINNVAKTAETLNEAVITINFLNSDIFDKYKTSFYEYINKFHEFDAKILDNSIIITKDKNIKLSDFLLTDSKAQSESDAESTSTKSRKRKQKPKSKKELFMVDTTPSGDQTNTPKYSSKFKVLGLEVEEVEHVQAAPTCFNCNGNHTLKDCPEPKNFAKIKAARLKFKPGPGKAPRYHLEDDQKFAHLKPGQLSEKLRTALGLGKYQVPSHVYKMRIMGYPPGWLEEAKFVHSNIDLFDIEGKNVKQKRKVQGIDPEKVIAYPGFNVKADRGFRDECNYYNVPPFSENHSKNAMIDFYNQLHLLQQPQGVLEDDLETCDMEIDEKDEESQESEGARLSPTLRDLEIQKKQLLEALNDQDPENSLSNDLALSAKENNENTPNSLVKTTVFGTPILKSTSPYSRLPKQDNFSKDISPILNFENLPNCTGKYEQMTNVLEKVRKTLKDLQEKT